MMGRSFAIAALGVCGLIGIAGPACGDAVTDWNEIAQQAIAAGRPGPIGAVDSALVQVAVHDAVQAIDGRFEPYLVEIKGAKGRRSAAAAAAAHAVLVAIYPAQATALETLYLNYLADHGLNGDPGLLVGEQVAARIAPLRRADPSPLPPPFTGGTGIGQWRPTPSFIGNPPAPPSGAPMAVHWMAGFDPFTLTGATRLRADPPPALTSERYRREYDEVKRLGSFSSTERTAAQTDLAYFYTDNFLAQWNRALRGIANNHLRRTGDSARLFALANLSVADALITAWDSKKFYNLWRPITAINEGDNDGNPHTVGDPAWRPLINTPNYPDYTSGANNVVGAMTRTLQLFFGRDRLTFEVTSLAPLATTKTRIYDRFSDAAADVVEVRIYLGIHFRAADVVARKQGQRVAEHAFRHFLLPLRDNRGHDHWDDDRD
jgi:hypothetical protein